MFFGDRCESESTAILGQRILVHLRTQRAIFILDNFETISDDLPLMRWLSTVNSPARGLITTREVPSGLSGRVVRIQELSRADAIQMFQIRAADAGVRDSVSDSITDQLCSAVGDHPLSVDLLAARSARTPAARLLEQLRKGLAVLDARSDPTRPDRHQSARACIEGSFAELSSPARELLCALCVLPTGFGSDLIVAIAQSDDFDSAAEELVDASLWRLGGDLYSMHPLIRSYAIEQLIQNGSRAETERRAAIGIAACLTKQLPNVLPGPDFVIRSRKYLNWCAVQLANIEAAAEFAEKNGEWRAMSAYAKGMEFFYNNSGHWPMAERIGEKLLTIARQLNDPAELIRGHQTLGFVYRHQGRDKEAIEAYQNALTICEMHPPSFDRRPYILARMGKALSVLGRLPEAEQHIRRALAEFRLLGDNSGEAIALVYLGQNTKFMNEWETAIAIFREALILARQLGNVSLERETLYNLGDTLAETGEYCEAEICLQTSVDYARDLGNEEAESKAISGLGRVALRRGELSKARELLHRGLVIHRKTGYRNREGRALRRLAEVEFAAGDFAAALDFAEQAVEVLKAVQAHSAWERAQQFLDRLKSHMRGE